MDRQLTITKDGSHTISVPAIASTYHSTHGAISESQHVFIEAGLRPFLTSVTNDPITILEMGFGTGLNTLLTLIETEKISYPVHYTALELFPISTEEAAQLNYCEQLNRKDLEPIFQQLHTAPWEEDISITTRFTLHKIKQNLADFETARHYDLIYFDAFSPIVQPELWTQDIFEKLSRSMKPNAVLVTYCSKSIVRRAMMAAGLTVKKIPGPHGKREMVRASR